MTGDALDVVAQRRTGAVGDRGVGADPGVELPVGGVGVAGAARGVGLLDRLVDEAQPASGRDTGPLGDLGEGEGLRPRERVRRPGVRGRVAQHGDRHVGDVGAGHSRHTTLAGRAADHPGRVREQREQVEVEVVAQDRERHPARGDGLLGVVVVAPEGERGRGVRAGEGCVDDVLHAGVRGGRDERAVLVAPVCRLGGGHHEQQVHAVERGPRGGAVAVRRHEHRQPEVGGARHIAHQQPRRQIDEGGGDEAAEGTGRTGQRDHGPMVAGPAQPSRTMRTSRPAGSSFSVPSSANPCRS